MEREDEEKERRDLKRMLYGENIKGEAKTDPSEMEMKCMLIFILLREKSFIHFSR